MLIVLWKTMTQLSMRLVTRMRTFSHELVRKFSHELVRKFSQELVRKLSQELVRKLT